MRLSDSSVRASQIFLLVISILILFTGLYFQFPKVRKHTNDLVLKQDLDINEYDGYSVYSASFDSTMTYYVNPQNDLPFSKDEIVEYTKESFEEWDKQTDKNLFEFGGITNEQGSNVVWFENLDSDASGRCTIYTENDTITEFEIRISNDSEKVPNVGTLKSVLLHESGHALGLAHTDDSNQIMYPYLHEDKTYLGHGDANGVKHLYEN